MDLQIDLPMENPLDDLEGLARFNLRLKLIERRGPAGGNPLVEISGTPENIRAWIAEVYFGGEGTDEDIEHQMSM